MQASLIFERLHTHLPPSPSSYEAARRLFSSNRGDAYCSSNPGDAYCSSNRGDAYCSWRSTMISLLVQDTRWTKFRQSNQQERYNYKAIQLVVTRYTCTQVAQCQEPLSPLREPKLEGGMQTSDLSDAHHAAPCLPP